MDRIAENWNCPFGEISETSFGLCETVETIGTENFVNRNRFWNNKYALGVQTNPGQLSKSSRQQLGRVNSACLQDRLVSTT